jgi:hypothetical protein
LSTYPPRRQGLAHGDIMLAVVENQTKQKGGINMKYIGILVAAAALIALGACGQTQPIQNVENQPIILPPGKKQPNMNEVTTAIMRAGTRLGWVMQPEGPGRVSGRIALRTHTAAIDVEHTTKSYTIKYRDSQNLDAKDGMIHRNYNGWIQNLDKAIRSELTLL